MALDPTSITAIGSLIVATRLNHGGVPDDALFAKHIIRAFGGAHDDGMVSEFSHRDSDILGRGFKGQCSHRFFGFFTGMRVGMASTTLPAQNDHVWIQNVHEAGHERADPACFGTNEILHRLIPGADGFRPERRS